MFDGSLFWEGKKKERKDYNQSKKSDISNN